MTKDHPGVRRIEPADWAWLAAWARDAEIDRRLGPMDAEWFEYVLGDDTGVQLVVEDERGRPFAVVGCVWDAAGDSHVISDVAVAPALRRNGFGRAAIGAALKWNGHPPAARWTAFIEPDNEPALQLFRSDGWVCEGLDEGMIRVSVSVSVSGAVTGVSDSVERCPRPQGPSARR